MILMADGVSSPLLELFQKGFEIQRKLQEDDFSSTTEEGKVRSRTAYA